MNNGPVAVKFEPRKTDAPQLRDEYRTYKILAGLGKKEEGRKSNLRKHSHNFFCNHHFFSRSDFICSLVGIPAVYYFGQEGLHNILCIDLLGPSLEDMFELCQRKFSIKSVCMAAKQMVGRFLNQ